MQEKKKSSLVLGILSIIFGFFIPLVGLILGIIGLVLANSHQKESKLDYKTEKNSGYCRDCNFRNCLDSKCHGTYERSRIVTKKLYFLKLFYFTNFSLNIF